jgi:hypothetical protein
MSQTLLVSSCDCCGANDCLAWRACLPPSATVQASCVVRVKQKLDGVTYWESTRSLSIFARFNRVTVGGLFEMQADPASISLSCTGLDRFYSDPNGNDLLLGACNPFPIYPITECKPRALCYTRNFAGAQVALDTITISCGNPCAVFGGVVPYTLIRIFPRVPYITNRSAACGGFSEQGVEQWEMLAWGQAGCLNNQTYDRVFMNLIDHDLIGAQVGNGHEPTPNADFCVESQEPYPLYDPTIYSPYARTFNYGVQCVDGRAEYDPQGNLVAACGCDNVPQPCGTQGFGIGSSGEAILTAEAYSNAAISVTIP